MSYSELELRAGDKVLLNKVVDSLASLLIQVLSLSTSCRISNVSGSSSSNKWLKSRIADDFQENAFVKVILASLFLEDAQEIAEGIPNATAVQLDALNQESLCNYISLVDVVISLLPASFHSNVASTCLQIQQKCLVKESSSDKLYTEMLLPHTFVDPTRLPELFEMAKEAGKTSKRVCQVYGCVETCQDMVEPKDSSKSFDKLQDPMRNDCPLVGISDISYVIEGSSEFISQTTFIHSPFFR